MSDPHNGIGESSDSRLTGVSSTKLERSRAFLNPKEGSKAVTNRQWEIEPGWTAVIETAGQSDQEAIKTMLPEGVDVVSLSEAGNPGALPHVVFADFLDADQVCTATDVRNVLFVFNMDDLEEKSETLENQSIRALIDRRLLRTSPLVPSVLECLLGRSKILDFGRTAGLGLRTFTLRSSVDRDAFFREILGVISEAALDEQEVTSLRLAIEEMTTNALIHAFEGEDGIRYDPRSFEMADLHNRVTVDFGLTDRYFLLRVADSAGSLNPDIVRTCLHRQLSGEGVLDAGGRGFFLGFSIATLFVVAVDPGKETEVFVIYDRDQCSQGSALLICP